MGKMQLIADNYKNINQVIDNAIDSIKIVLPYCITKEDLKAQAFYQICLKIKNFDSEKGTISQYCFRIAKHAVICFLQRVSPYQYRKSRNIALSDDPNICKTKEINFEHLYDTQDQSNMFDIIAAEDLFKKTIARLKSRERFLALVIYRQGWDIKDLMAHYKCDQLRARNLRGYMQRRFRENLQKLEK